MKRGERGLAAVPGWVRAALAAALAAQLAFHARQPPRSAAADLPPAPAVQSLRFASLGEPEALARLAMLYLQSYDLGGANAVPYRNLDYERLVSWLSAILALDPRSDYPLFAAARVYAENPDPEKSRRILEFVYREFFAAPNQRWPWLAHAALVAKHRLNDLPLARRYATAVDRHTTDPAVPLWARQMEIFILEDMDEIEAAVIMLGGLLESGAVHDPAEARFLAERLQALKQRHRR